MNANPFQRAGVSDSGSRSVSDSGSRPVSLSDLDILPESWHSMTVAQKAAAVLQKSPRANVVDVITRIDASHPTPVAITHRERVVYVPAIAPAGQAAPAPMNTASIVGWGLLLLVAGGILYATVNQK